MNAGRRFRPGDSSWPSDAAWDGLRRQVGGRLIRLESPLAACRTEPDGSACADALVGLGNPYYLGDQPALTQTSGWLDAWTPAPSVYAVAAEKTEDVVAGVNFAREHGLRVVVKGGSHSYQGRSSSVDSLLIWTRAMHRIVLHDAFVARGCAGTMPPQPAVTIGAGAIWMQVYDAVTTRAGHYVQGGGCTTVGVAGLIASGGFGSFSKAYGLAAAGLLEAEVVTADGVVRIVNPCTEPDLFWALKGGGGGTFGVVARLTLRVRALPQTLGGVTGTIRARSDAAFRTLIDRILGFYREHLFNPRWGEQIRFQPDLKVAIGMVFHGLTRPQAERVWRPFVDWVSEASRDLAWETPLRIVEVPARHFWDAAYLARHAPGRMLADNRATRREGSFFWAGNRGEAGQFMHGYRSAWLPAWLLDEQRRRALAEAIFAGSRHWGISLHFNKGLGGAPAAERAAATDTATNPVVLDAFALAVIVASGPPAFPDLPSRGPDLAAARREAEAVGRAMDELLKVVPEPGSYVSETDYFQRDWREAFWGPNHPRLDAVKRRYDPDGLFIVHHGVGSEDWSVDGFTRSGHVAAG